MYNINKQQNKINKQPTKTTKNGFNFYKNI